jgi:hypothetical protein
MINLAEYIFNDTSLIELGGVLYGSQKNFSNPVMQPSPSHS